MDSTSFVNTWKSNHPGQEIQAHAFTQELRVRLDTTHATADSEHKLRVGLTEHIAGNVWSGAVSILPTSTLSPGSKDASLFTELAAQISGGWRFVLGTTLQVPTGNDSTAAASSASASTTADASRDKEFRKFVAGGGNLSLAAMRPVGLWNRDFGSHLLFVLPRLWANVPALSNSENVTNFGGEVAAEYQYQRYARTVAQLDDPNDTTAPTPFLIFQITSGIVHGTNSFYRGIGRTNHHVFAYVSPTVSFVVQDQVKLG
ncbi:MAG: hypothetical protein JO306_05425, partial [Gemmatimonadetes bacterium]|nr:hypothetical protein [Gemmatimonadota bacterium]